MPNQQLIEEKLTTNLRKLELLQLERRLDAIIQGKNFSGKSFKEQLNLLLEDELTFRQERAIKMRLKLAKFPVVKSIDGFDFSFQPDLDKETVLSLFGLSFVREKENIILIGPSGVGKTHLPLSRVDANLFFQLISTRYENGPTILTSNKSYIEWNDFFPDEGIAAAILDRLLHYSRTIKINGQSYRLAMKKKMGLFEKSKQ